jgi:hypothetical protein
MNFYPSLNKLCFICFEIIFASAISRLKNRAVAVMKSQLLDTLGTERAASFCQACRQVRSQAGAWERGSLGNFRAADYIL